MLDAPEFKTYLEVRYAVSRMEVTGYCMPRTLCVVSTIFQLRKLTRFRRARDQQAAYVETTHVMCMEHLVIAKNKFRILPSMKLGMDLISISNSSMDAVIAILNTSSCRYPLMLLRWLMFLVVN